MRLQRIEFGSFKNSMVVKVMRTIDKVESLPSVPQDFIEFNIQHGSQSLHYNLQSDEAAQLLEMLQAALLE